MITFDMAWTVRWESGESFDLAWFVGWESGEECEECADPL